MKQKPLGKTGRGIGPIGLGCVTFGREIDEESSRRIMDYAVEKGITFFDTAEAYGGGQSKFGRKNLTGVDDIREQTLDMSSSELIVGRWMKDRSMRNEITLCTKVSTGASADNINKALSASLERLGTDSVDVYKIHSPDPSTPIEETMAALDQEVRNGRVTAAGGSNYSAEQLQESLNASKNRGYARFEVIQPPYNLIQREVELDLFPLCKREQIAITSYSPLGAGFLAGKYDSDRSNVPTTTRFGIAPGHINLYFSDKNFDTVEMLRKKSEEMDIPMVQLAMAWVMTNPDVTTVLIGARTTAHIDNALKAYSGGLNSELRSEMSNWANE